MRLNGRDQQSLAVTLARVCFFFFGGGGGGGGGVKPIKCTPMSCSASGDMCRSVPTAWQALAKLVRACAIAG